MTSSTRPRRSKHLRAIAAAQHPAFSVRIRTER